MGVPMSALPDAVPGIPKGGSLPPRPHPLERHRRSGGRGATATPPATCGIVGAHIEMAMPYTSTPMSMCTRGTPPTPAVRRSRSAPWKSARTPCREPVDRRSGPRGPEQVLQLDDPLEAALQPAMLLDHRVVHAADRLLDPVDLAAGRAAGFGGGGAGGGGIGPSPEGRRCPLEFPGGAEDGHDLDGSAPLPERIPEPPVRIAPRPERRRGLVARTGVDEDGAPGVQRDGQLEREAGISLRKYLWDNDLVTPSEIRVSPGVSEGRKSSYPLGLRQKRNRSVVPWRDGR